VNYTYAPILRKCGGKKTACLLKKIFKNQKEFKYRITLDFLCFIKC